MAAMALTLGACSSEDLDPKSVFDDSVSMPENDFDRWLKTNYVDEYNILELYVVFIDIVGSRPTMSMNTTYSSSIALSLMRVMPVITSLQPNTTRLWRWPN